jgi:hypothetical protein
MPVMKITLSTAMRARDVSRPHAEHLERAAEHEESVGSTGVPSRLADEGAGRQAVVTAHDDAAEAAPGRRRRRRRSSPGDDG